MSKKYIIAVLALLLIILLGIGFWYWQFKRGQVETPSKTILPSTSTNPLDNKPNINPVDQTNPFKNIKTNPFE
jgi:hypothetical protein